jgi:hypothetical protein
VVRCPTTRTARAAFGGQLLVIDGDLASDPSAASGSATIVKVGPHRHLEVVRHSIQDATFTGDTQRFLQHLIRRRGTQLALISRFRALAPIP